MEQKQNDGSGIESSEEKLTDKESRDALDVHRQIVVWLFIAVLVLFLGLASSLVLLDQGKKGPSCLVVVGLTGMIGGFVSALKRLYTFQDVFPKKNYSSLFKGYNFYVICYSTIPPLVGMIAAVILYVVFASGMLKGDLFPAFHCGSGDNMCNQFKSFISDWQPATATDYAKVIVWAFVAGFSERFVPDILNKLGEGGVK